METPEKYDDWSPKNCIELTDDERARIQKIASAAKKVWGEIGKKAVKIWEVLKRMGTPDYKSFPPTVYEARDAGREYCETQGSDHYRRQGPEPMDLIIAAGYAEGYCLGSAIKYIDRYYRTRDKEDLKKAADMVQIYCGIELVQKSEAEREDP